MEGNWFFHVICFLGLIISAAFFINRGGIMRGNQFVSGSKNWEHNLMLFLGWLLFNAACGYLNIFVVVQIEKSFMVLILPTIFLGAVTIPIVNKIARHCYVAWCANLESGI